ncbi:DNA topoisomerase VI subunit B, partial [Haladaptatus sp.]|uniref:DNA topoisomerase VI subunit B n=1 Tax=Haladaptatus sp. TaxID=1973141 RepID=UPI003C67405F
MPSMQSTLGDEGIAEELAESQRQISIAEFFEKNKHMLGFDSGARGMVTAVKEAVDNALDASEEARLKPFVRVKIEEVGDYYRLIVEDEGPGITREQIPKVFGKLLYGSRFHKREQSRGQQGIGISAAVLYSQLTSGKPAKITSKPKGSDRQRYFELIIDTDENEPEIQTESDTPPVGRELVGTHGTRIELEMEANMRARQQLLRYIKHTAVVNPHAKIVFEEPGMDNGEEMVFERAEGASLPTETEEIRPHPHGVELGTLLKMLSATDSHSISGFLQEEFTRVGKKTAENVIENFRDLHFGREAAWRPPQAHEEVDLESAIEEAVANKGADATASFAGNVVVRVEENER